MKLIYLLVLIFFNISCAYSNTDNLVKVHFEKFFETDLFSISKSDKISISVDDMTDATEKIDSHISFKIPNIEKILILIQTRAKECKGKTESVELVAKYKFNPKMNLSRVSQRVRTSVDTCVRTMLTWVKTMNGQYYYNSFKFHTIIPDGF